MSIVFLDKTYARTHADAGEDDIVVDDLSGPELLELYNLVASNLNKSRVRKFSDRKTALRRTWAILMEYDESFDPEGCVPMGTPTGGVTGETAPETTPKKPERRSKHADEQLIVRDASFNPHREGTKSHATYEMVRNNPGITFQEALNNGARRNTLNFDLRLGHILRQEAS